MTAQERTVEVELPDNIQERATPKQRGTHAKLQIAFATVLSILGCWGLLVACSAFIAYLLNVPIHLAWFAIPGIAIGCSLLYLSSRLWTRWLLGVGIIALSEGALLLSVSLLPLLAAEDSDRAITRSLFTSAIAGIATGLALLAREIVSKHGDSR